MGPLEIIRQKLSYGRGVYPPLKPEASRRTLEGDLKQVIAAGSKPVGANPSRVNLSTQNGEPVSLTAALDRLTKGDGVYAQKSVLIGGTWQENAKAWIQEGTRTTRDQLYSVTQDFSPK
jgi:hypothetical protein